MKAALQSSSLRISLPSWATVLLVACNLAFPFSASGADPVADAITAAGGIVEQDETVDGRPIISIRAAGSEIAEDVFTRLPEAVTLQFLDVSDSPMTDEGLRFLKDLKRLEQIDLSGTRVTDDGIAELAGLEQLESINLERTALSDAGLTMLMQLPKLSFIRVGETRVTEAKIAELRAKYPLIQIVSTPPAMSSAPDLPPDTPPNDSTVPAAPNENEKTGTAVTVFYGTNRRSTSPTPDAKRLGEFYGSERGQLEFGVCTVGIPADHKRGNIERPWSLGPIKFPEDPRKHVVLRSIEPKTRDVFFDQLKAAVANAKQTGSKNDAFVFVHGFNVSFENAAFRTAQLAFDLEFEGPAIMFSWPSLCAEQDYLADVEIATVSAGAIKEFLSAVAKESGARRIHLIAHSMGNLAMTRALASLATDRGGNGDPEFDQILLTAPDIDAEVFEEEIAPNFLKTGRRVTLYASTNDWALVGSRRLRANRTRLGEDITRSFAQKLIEAVDASNVDTSLLGHSYFGEQLAVIRDIQGVFAGKSRLDRGLIKWGPDNQYWAFSSGRGFTVSSKWLTGWWPAVWICSALGIGIVIGRRLRSSSA